MFQIRTHSSLRVGLFSFFFFFFNSLSFDFGSHIAWCEIFTRVLLCELSNFWKFRALIS